MDRDLILLPGNRSQRRVDVIQADLLPAAHGRSIGLGRRHQAELRCLRTLRTPPLGRKGRGRRDGGRTDWRKQRARHCSPGREGRRPSCRPHRLHHFSAGDQGTHKGTLLWIWPARSVSVVVQFRFVVAAVYDRRVGVRPRSCRFGFWPLSSSLKICKSRLEFKAAASRPHSNALREVGTRESGLRAALDCDPFNC